MHPLIQLKRATSLFLVALACFGLLPTTQAVVPPPDGGYPGFTTAEGTNALNNLTTGVGNTAVGWYSLFANSTASYNTGVGAGTLALNDADSNTAIGATALFLNTSGFENSAVGFGALALNDTGGDNTATGFRALSSNTSGFANTANGTGALFSNTTGTSNTAVGWFALQSNTEGGNNTIIGAGAGGSITTASNVICIGANVSGENASSSCYIGHIFNATSSGGSAVFVNTNGKLGTNTSSKRFKEEIKSMDKASEALLALKPVTFRYKKEIDPAGTSQFGLVAEEVERVNPDLVVRDKEGKPYSVRYDQVNAMLLNEFLKEHRKNEEQEATIARLIATDTRQQKQIETLTAALQKVSAQLELRESAAETVLNNQ
jgi:Chaperone of endosialidase